jgi:hypothetical protein
MAKRKKLTLEAWHDNAGGFNPARDFAILQEGLAAGFLDEQDEYGMTALSFAVMSEWREGVDALLRAGANTELRYFRTEETPLYLAVVYPRSESLVALLLAWGANPDAANCRGQTPRTIAAKFLPRFRGFDTVPIGAVQHPVPRIQNAEHLADHYHPRFKIPSRDERETLKPGQAVDLHVYGPQVASKQDAVKVRITARKGRRPHVQYTGRVETPTEMTHLPLDATELTFGPENIATVYVARSN